MIPKLPDGEIKVVGPDVNWDSKRYKLWGGQFGHYLRLGFERLNIPVEKSTELLDLSREIKGCPVPLDITIDGKNRRVWFDFADQEYKVKLRLIGPDDLYFKIQYKLEHCGKHPQILPIPIGVFQYDEYFDELRYHRGLRKECWERNDWKFDVAFIARATNFKERVEAALELEKSGLKCLLGIVPHPRRKEIPKEILRKRGLPVKQYWKRIACSKVVVSGSGTAGYWDWRFTEAIGMGCCVLKKAPIGYPYAGIKDSPMPFVPYMLEGEKHLQYSASVVTSDGPPIKEQEAFTVKHIAETAKELCSNDGFRLWIESNARLYWDRWASPEAVCRYMLHETATKG